MKTVGIIAEYNPFHEGHLYQIRQVRQRFHADFVVIAMSGDFVQRGEPAIYDKYLRTEIALAAGADLVLELPVCFATSSAEDFAFAGVTLFDRLGVVDGLCFGSESGDLASMTAVAELLSSEPEQYKKLLQEYLRSGDSFPRARAKALSLCFAASASEKPSSGNVEALLSSPNNILGVEYLKSLIRRKSQIEPMTLRRTGQGYHDCFLPEDGAFPSASALRRGISASQVDYARLLCSLGLAADNFLSAPGRLTPVFPDDLSLIFNWRLQELIQAGQNLAAFADLSPELAARLTRASLEFDTYTGRIRQLKTRQYTYTRISRGLLHLMLGITDEDLSLARGMDYIPYVRILGFRRSAKPLLSGIKQNCPLPLITKTADARQLLDTDGLKLFQKDIHASHLRQALAFSKNGIQMPNEYTRSVIIL